MKLKNKIALTTFSLFMVEAIVHYNQGKNDTQKKKEVKGFLPPTKSLLKIALVVGAFSIVNGMIVEKLES